MYRILEDTEEELNGSVGSEFSAQPTVDIQLNRYRERVCWEERRGKELEISWRFLENQATYISIVVIRQQQQLQQMRCHLSTTGRLSRELWIHNQAGRSLNHASQHGSRPTGWTEAAAVDPLSWLPSAGFSGWQSNIRLHYCHLLAANTSFLWFITSFTYESGCFECVPPPPPPLHCHSVWH